MGGRGGGGQVHPSLLRSVLFPFAVHHRGSGSSGSKRPTDLRSPNRHSPLCASVSSPVEAVPTPEGLGEGGRLIPCHRLAPSLGGPLEGLRSRYGLPGSGGPVGHGGGRGVLWQLTTGGGWSPVLGPHHVPAPVLSPLRGLGVLLTPPLQRGYACAHFTEGNLEGRNAAWGRNVRRAPSK